ncbi:SPFH domain / Band 7 family protein [Planctomycetes bacterium Pla163]|uniref:SPFH domain / Band 7 family protein n=1 Tax=Rohdeia mirabilis TaxID=2528008 RepID=A0A518CYB9_9BACT|nr:SPFH domain / Band 7 family protein [Planctomycetes bacterium Pla163]
MKKTLTIAIVGVSALVIIGVLLGSLFLTKVPPHVVGVKQNQLGGGIVQQDYGTGYHLGIVFVHKWYELDKRVHFVNFSKEQSSRWTSDANVVNSGSLDIRTSDNNTASLDVTVTYRIKEDEAYQMVEDGIQVDYRDKVARSVRGILMKELPKLSPEDLVDTQVRLQRVTDTLPLMREELAQYHVEPLHVLIRAVRFPVDYEEKLQAKQLTRQNALLANARQRQEKQSQVTQSYEKETEALEKRLRGEWDVKLQVTRSDNEVLVAQIEADAAVYQRQTRADAEADYVTAIAEGELELAKAEALRNELRNAALDTAGGRILLAQRAAENLDIDTITLNSNDPSVPTVLDIQSMVDLLLGRSGAQKP